MSFRPTSIFEWALVGYAAVVLVVTLVVSPLVIGLGEDSADSSPMKALPFGGGFSFGSGESKRAHRRRRAKAQSASTTNVARSSDPCQAAIVRMISCTKDAKVRQQLSARKDRFAAECRRSKKDVRKARRCVKRSSCKDFERCLSGG